MKWIRKFFRAIGYEGIFALAWGGTSIAVAIFSQLGAVSRDPVVNFISATSGSILISVVALLYRERTEADRLRQLVGEETAKLQNTLVSTIQESHVKWIGDKFPEFANQQSLERMVNDCLARRFFWRDSESIARGQEWLYRTLRSPLRNWYDVEVKLLDKPIDEKFPPSRVGVPDVQSGHIWVETKFEYDSGANEDSEPILLNRDGDIHYFRVNIPETTQLVRMHQSSPLSHEEIKYWIMNTVQPTVEVFEDGKNKPIKTAVEIDDLRAEWQGRGLRLKFNVKSDYMLQPGHRVTVVYGHRCCKYTFDLHHWVASAVTKEFSFTMKGFENFNLIPIATNPRVTNRRELTVKPDGMKYHGLIYPNTTFAYVWLKEPDHNHD